LATSKTFLNQELFGSNEPNITKLQGTQLYGLMDIFSTLSSSNIKNFVSSFRHGNFGHGPLDKILQSKRNHPYDYIQDSVFLGQGQSNVFLFKMSTKGEGNGVDIVAHMQLGRDS
jgi:hypothetical protein